MSQQTQPQMAEQDPHDVERAADRVGEAMLFPVAVARRVLPEHDLPVYLGMGALAIAGLIDWPVAAAAGIGYAALKRWGKPRAHNCGQRVDVQRRPHRERSRPEGIGRPAHRPMAD